MPENSVNSGFLINTKVRNLYKKGYQLLNLVVFGYIKTGKELKIAYGTKTGID